MRLICHKPNQSMNVLKWLISSLHMLKIPVSTERCNSYTNRLLETVMFSFFFFSLTLHWKHMWVHQMFSHFSYQQALILLPFVVFAFTHNYCKLIFIISLWQNRLLSEISTSSINF